LKSLSMYPCATPTTFHAFSLYIIMLSIWKSGAWIKINLIKDQKCPFYELNRSSLLACILSSFQSTPIDSVAPYIV
jgi:hypothetical protein